MRQSKISIPSWFPFDLSECRHKSATRIDSADSRWGWYRFARPPPPPPLNHALREHTRHVWWQKTRTFFIKVNKKVNSLRRLFYLKDRFSVRSASSLKRHHIGLCNMCTYCVCPVYTSTLLRRAIFLYCLVVIALFGCDLSEGYLHCTPAKPNRNTVVTLPIARGSIC